LSYLLREKSGGREGTLCRSSRVDCTRWGECPGCPGPQAAGSARDTGRAQHPSARGQRFSVGVLVDEGPGSLPGLDAYRCTWKCPL